MANTRPNIVIPANTVVNLYAALNAQTGFPTVSVGTQISVKMLGTGQARLFSGDALSGAPDDSTGYEELDAKNNERINDSGDAGAFIWSNVGCTINAKVV